MSASPSTRAAALIVLLAGCSRPLAHAPADAGEPDGPVLVIGGAPLPPDAAADRPPIAAAPWERACIDWLLASCAKARACNVVNSDCSKTEAQLLELCRQKTSRTCARPAPESFRTCQLKNEAQTCDQYCMPGQQFCFDFCFFTCLDGQPVDAREAGPDLPQVPEGTVTTDGPRDLVRLELQVHHLVADRARRRLYATVGSRSARAPNALVVIDPATLTIERSLFVGSDPSVLAQSVDGSRLWMGLDGAQALRRVDLGGSVPAAGPQYPLPADRPGIRLKVRTMIALPDSPDTVALTIDSTDISSLHGTMVLDGGKPRPLLLDDRTDASQLLRGPDGWIFGYNDVSTGYDFYAIAVQPQGLMSRFGKRELLEGFETRIVYAGQRVFSSNGEVLDVTDPASPVAAGKLPAKGLLAFGAGPGRALMLSQGAETTIRNVDTAQLQELTSFSLGPLPEARVWDFDSLDDDTAVFVAGDAGPPFHPQEGRAIYLVRHVRTRFKLP